MGFFFSLIGYLAAIALLISGAVAGSMYMSRPKAAIAQAERVTEPGGHMRDASAALPKQQLPPKHALRRRLARRHVSRRQ
jgi:hypothetical protein